MGNDNVPQASLRIGNRHRVKARSGKSQGTGATPRGYQVTAQVDRNLQEDSNILSDNMLHLISGALEDLTAQVTAQVVWHCRRSRFANEILEFPGARASCPRRLICEALAPSFLI